MKHLRCPHTTPGTVTSRMTTPLLFPELIALIIDHFYDDRTSLATCSLVSHWWRISSQFHLFYHIRVRTMPPQRGLIAFTRFLHGSPRIAKYVRKLTLIGVGDVLDRRDDGVHDARLGKRIGPVLLAAILQPLPAIRTLTLHRLQWDESRQPWTCGGALEQPLPVTIAQRPSSPFRTIRKLVLSSFTSCSPGTSGCNILSYFLPIQELHLSDVIFLYGEPRLIIPPTMEVERLVLGRIGAPTRLYTNLQHGALADMLQSLRLPFEDLCFCPALALWLLDIGPRLVRLELDMRMHKDSNRRHCTLPSQRRWDLTGLSSCTSLRSIEFHITVNGPSSSQIMFEELYWSTILHIISYIRSPSLKNASITVTRSSDVYFDHLVTGATLKNMIKEMGWEESSSLESYD